MIIVYTGNGKGKTTAALGLAIRAAGWGQRVAIIQFIKGYKNTGEWKIIKQIQKIEIFQTHNDEKIGIGNPEEKHRESAKEALKLAKNIISKGKHQIVILDEINNAIHHDLVEAGEVMKLISTKPVEVSVIFTGRDASKELINVADLVTEMKEIKHPFQKGITAKKGIDY